MAMQTRQLAELLTKEGAAVMPVPVNPPYQPACIARIRGLRALFRLLPYIVRLWRCAGSAQVMHVMANSGWSWHLFAAPAIWMARLRGLPVLVNYRGGEAPAFLARSIRWVRPTLRMADVVAVPSRFLQEAFGSHGIVAEVLPNIVDLARFRRELRPARADPRLVVARNLEEMYDIGTALRAFARVRESLPGARLFIAGSGPELSSLQAVARSLNVAESVTFTGRLDRDAVAALYRDCDVMLNPTRVDNMPNSLLEAMACGLPIVSTRVGGVPYIVRDGYSALLVDCGDHAGMAEATLRVLGDRELATTLATAAFTEVQQYTWDRVRTRLSELYGRICRMREPGMRTA
ncbi:MAG TPA: glycosyltransferase family 4 protein [Burkholderiales bacterium]|nr:glycosyltransferase family 4 protein [Burkholderiales bacterium]